MTDQAIQRCTANKLVRVGENDPGKNRICELPPGHSGPHAADYCGLRLWWYSPDKVKPVCPFCGNSATVTNGWCAMCERSIGEAATMFEEKV